MWERQEVQEVLRDDRALIGIAAIQVDESFVDVIVYPLIQCYKFGCLGGDGGGGGDGGIWSGNGSSRAGSGSGSGAGGGGGSRRGRGGTCVVITAHPTTVGVRYFRPRAILIAESTPDPSGGGSSAVPYRRGLSLNDSSATSASRRLTCPMTRPSSSTTGSFW